MVAWLWASKVDAGDASVPDYATILFGVSSVCGAVILFLQRVRRSHFSPPLVMLTERMSVFLFLSHRENVQQPSLGIFIFCVLYFFIYGCVGGSVCLFY